MTTPQEVEVLTLGQPHGASHCGCGNKYMDDSQFCRICGQPRRAATAAATAAVGTRRGAGLAVTVGNYRSPPPELPTEPKDDDFHDSDGHSLSHKPRTCCAQALLITQTYSLPLLAGVVLAMVMANMAEEPYDEIFHTDIIPASSWTVFGHAINFHFLINDIFMAFFFGIATKEITEACLPGGSLNPPSKAANPLFATIGGVAGPVGMYFLLGSVLYAQVEFYHQRASHPPFSSPRPIWRTDTITLLAPQESFGAPSETDFCAPYNAAEGGGHRRLAADAAVSTCLLGTKFVEAWGEGACALAAEHCTGGASAGHRMLGGNLTNSTHDNGHVTEAYVVQSYAWSIVANGWGIPTATDISLAWVIATVIFGAGPSSLRPGEIHFGCPRYLAAASDLVCAWIVAGHPAISFLLLLAVADDGLGLIIIAIFYPSPDHAFNGMVGLPWTVFSISKRRTITVLHLDRSSLKWLC